MGAKRWSEGKGPCGKPRSKRVIFMYTERKYGVWVTAYRPVAGCCENRNESSDPENVGTFLDRLSSSTEGIRSVKLVNRHGEAFAFDRSH
jgi:hypothetical protein